MWPFKKKTPRSDAWLNNITGLGTSRDKRTGGVFRTDLVTDFEARELWRADDIAARVIETLPREVLRQGYKVKVQQDEGDTYEVKEIQEACQSMLEDLHADDKFYQALCYRRAYGGGALWLVTNDQQGSLVQPLKAGQSVDLRALHALEPAELPVASWYDDPRDSKFGTPKTYRLNLLTPGGFANTQEEIHESRLIIFPGLKVSRANISGQRPGWGDSVLSRMMHVLRDFNLAFDGANHLVADMSQGVFKVSGLIAALANDNDDTIKTRMQLMDMSRSMVRAILLDKESGEEFSRESTSFTDLPQLLEKFMLRLAAAADMPVTYLMGQSPAGMNATGESDRTFFYDRVAQEQRRVKTPMEQLVRMLFLSPDGPTGGIEPESWCIEFNPLEQPSEKEILETRKVQADIDAIYLDRSVYMASEVRSHWSGDSFSIDIELDPDFDEMVEEQATTALETPPPGATGEPSPAAEEPGTPSEPGAGPNPEDEEEVVDSGAYVHRDTGDFRFDFDPDQPRDEDGKFGEGGGGAAAPKEQGFAKVGAAKKGIKTLSKADLKKANLKTLVKKAGGDPAEAERLVKGWEEDKLTATGFEFHAAVAASAGLDPAQAVERTKQVLVKEHGHTEAQAAKVVERAVAAARDKDTQATVRAVAAASQAAYEGDTVTLYRGVTGAQADAVRAQLESGADVDFGTDAVTSFTDDEAVARSFATNGMVVRVQVPKESIVLSHKVVGGGKSREIALDKEVIAVTKGGLKVSRDNVRENVKERTKSFAEIQAEIAAGVPEGKRKSLFE